MDIEFFEQNWYLFVALVFIVSMIVLDPIRRRASGIRSVSAVELPRIISGNAVVVDVSDPGEFNNGRIPNAMNIPVAKIADEMKRLAKYKDKPVVLTCRTGTRSNRAASILKKNEFTDLYVLSGGVASWEKENLPIER